MKHGNNKNQYSVKILLIKYFKHINTNSFITNYMSENTFLI